MILELMDLGSEHVIFLLNSVEQSGHFASAPGHQFEVISALGSSLIGYQVPLALLDLLLEVLGDFHIKVAARGLERQLILLQRLDGQYILVLHHFHLLLCFHKVVNKPRQHAFHNHKFVNLMR
jgi:hypothetical protein